MGGRDRCACNRATSLVPSTPYRVSRLEFLHFRQKKLQRGSHREQDRAWSGRWAEGIVVPANRARSLVPSTPYRVSLLEFLHFRRKNLQWGPIANKIVPGAGDGRKGSLCLQSGDIPGALYSLSRFAARISPLSAKKTSVGPLPIFTSGAGLLLGLVPAAEELLGCLLVAPLHVAHKRNVFVALFAVTERARLPSLLEQAQVVGALVVTRLA